MLAFCETYYTKYMFVVVKMVRATLEPYPVGIFGKMGGFGWIMLQYE